MDKNTVLAMFLRIITEYEYLEYTEEELAEEFDELLTMAQVELQLQGLLEDLTDETVLSSTEHYILAYACVLLWVTPKVNSAELLAAQLTSTDFTQFSNANRLNACLKLYSSCEAKLNNLIADYDGRSVLASIKKELSDKDV